VSMMLGPSLYTALFVSLSMAGGSEGKGVPVVINTWPWPQATREAWKVIKSNGSLVDAIVAGCSAVEEDRSITSVGWGGSPSENGDTALDAMIMVGSTHDVGGVASMKRIKHASAVAKHVLQNTKHTLLVGEDATKFAVQMGFKEEDLHSDESKKQWEKWRSDNCQPNFWKNVEPDPITTCGPYHPKIQGDSTSKRDVTAPQVYVFDENNHDTIGLLAVDEKGDIVAGTSTNGATFKINGRVGDSAIVGSGAYVDNDVGAAAATGDGDVMMRFLPSYQAVENMRNGMSPSEAAEAALRRIVKFHDKFEGALVAVLKDGKYGGACYGWTFKYSVINDELGDAKIVELKPFDK